MCDVCRCDEGYILPELKIHWHRIAADHQKAWNLSDQTGQHYLFKDTAAGVTQAMKEKRDSLDARVSEALKVVVQYLCVSTFNRGDQGGDTAGTQQGILRTEQGTGEGARSTVLSREQGSDRPREEKGVQRGIPQGEQAQKDETNAGSEGGAKPDTARKVRQRSRVQRASEAKSQRELEPESQGKRTHRLKSNYGITPEQFEEMLTRQAGCARFAERRTSGRRG